MPRRPRLNDLDVRSWMRFTKSWFVCNPSPRTKAQRAHPGKFPEQLATEFITFFTREGETVLDPFSGVGSAVTASSAAGRRGVGIELSPEFHEVAVRDLALQPEARLIHGDARDALGLCRRAGVPEVHYILTSPPYWDMLRNSRGNVNSAHSRRREAGLPLSYSQDAADLGCIQDYDEFLDAVCQVLADLRSLLAPQRYVTVIVQNVRVAGGEVRPLAWDLVRKLSNFYTFKGERLWLQDNKPLGCWGWPSEFVTNVHHHYCLTFKNTEFDPL